MDDGLHDVRHTAAKVYIHLMPQKVFLIKEIEIVNGCMVEDDRQDIISTSDVLLSESRVLRDLLNPGVRRCRPPPGIVIEPVIYHQGRRPMQSR